MKTIVNNHTRIFYLCGDMNQERVCNLKDIPEVLKSFDDRDSVKIYFFWNFRLKRVFKKQLNIFFKANQMDFRIK